MNSIFKILTDLAGDSFALSKIVIGQAINGAVNGAAVFGFRDSAGNATMPQLDDDGNLGVALDSGTSIVIPMSKKTKAEMESAGKDVRVLIGTVALIPDRVYTAPSMLNVGSRATLFEMVIVEDVGGIPAETSILVGYLEAGQTTIMPHVLKDKFATNATVDVKELQLYATMKDTKSGDVYAKASVNLTPAS